MGKRGPKKEPTALRRLKGFPGHHRPKETSEPNPTSEGVRCPSWLDPVAKGEWRRLEEELRRLGLLTLVDVMAFAAYCKWYSRWRRYERKLDEAIRASGPADNGDLVTFKGGTQQQSPYVAMAVNAYKMMQATADRFGFTPASRADLGLPLDPTAPLPSPAAPRPPKTDEFEQFVKKLRHATNQGPA